MAAGKNGKPRVLVVEHDLSLLKMVQAILSKPYEVLAASTATEGLGISAAYEGTIHLLLSDVTMPGMIGPEIARLVKLQRPGMRVVLMSGYPDGRMLFLNSGWHFIEKPFVPAALLKMCREVLEQEISASAGFPLQVD